MDSPHAPDGSILIEVADDREDLRTEEEQAQEQAYQYELKSRKPGVDTEARWVRKGRHYRYGYKKHVLTDGQGLVESIITTPANCADTVVLPELIEKAELTQGVSVLADKGYCSKKNSACLLERGLIDGIMLKAQKGMKLTERQRELNNLISKTRCLIERTSGSIRRWFSGGRCRYRGLERTHTQNILEAMAYNLKRMPGLLCSRAPNSPEKPLSGGLSFREGARGRDRHSTSQPKDSDSRGKKVQAVRRWACAMVSGSLRSHAIHYSAQQGVQPNPYHR